MDVAGSFFFCYLFYFLFWETVNLGRFPFVRTDRPDHFSCNDNFHFNQNSPARSVKSWIVCTKGDGFSAKTLGKNLCQYQTDWPGRPVLTMESALKSDFCRMCSKRDSKFRRLKAKSLLLSVISCGGFICLWSKANKNYSFCGPKKISILTP